MRMSRIATLATALALSAGLITGCSADTVSDVAHDTAARHDTNGAAPAAHTDTFNSTIPQQQATPAHAADPSEDDTEGAIPPPTMNEPDLVTPQPPQGRDNFGAQPDSRYLWQAKLDRVIDGDTIIATVDRKDGAQQLRIRLLGFNAPEDTKTKEPGGAEATQHLKDLLGEPGSALLVEYDMSQGMTDKYDRTLAHVWATAPGKPDTPAVLTSTAMVADGHAKEYVFNGSRPNAHAQSIHQAEKAAR